MLFSEANNIKLGTTDVDAIYVGSTKVWPIESEKIVYFNQLINYDNITTSMLGASTGYDIVKVPSEHAITWTTLASASSYDALIIKNVNTLVPVTEGHMYLSVWDTEYTSGSTQDRPTDGERTGTYGGLSVTVLERYFGLPTDSKSRCYTRYYLGSIRSYSSVDYKCSYPTQRSQLKVSNMMLFDLTLMFGEGKEPTAQQFFEMFPDDYYNYNLGEYITI